MQLISTKQLCERLNVSKGTVEVWRETKVIPFIQINKFVRYNWDKVLDALVRFEHDAICISGNN